MKIGEEVIVKLLEKITETKYNVLDVKTNAQGKLVTKGNLKVSKDGYVHAWVISYDKFSDQYVYGNAYFGKYSISANIRDRYKNILQRLYSSPETIIDDDISFLKGMVNRCLKKDQWDWFTTYEYIGYPDSKTMHHFITDCINVRNSVRMNEMDILLDYREKYGFLFNNMLFHLGEISENSIDDFNKPIANIDYSIWEKLSFDSKKI